MFAYIYVCYVVVLLSSNSCTGTTEINIRVRRFSGPPLLEPPREGYPNKRHIHLAVGSHKACTEKKRLEGVEAQSSASCTGRTWTYQSNCCLRHHAIGFMVCVSGAKVGSWGSSTIYAQLEVPQPAPGHTRDVLNVSTKTCRR